MGIVYFAAIRDEQMRLCAADIMPLRGAGANAFFSRKKKALDQKSCANLQLDRLPAHIPGADSARKRAITGRSMRYQTFYLILLPSKIYVVIVDMLMISKKIADQ